MEPISEQDYLMTCEVVDWRHETILKQAAALSHSNPVQTARQCFEWVRDEIAHSLDAGAQELTCTASEVLAHGHGYCYAKSHLLAALLRANGIPAGLDYQRLWDEDGGFMLHGLNTVLLPGHGWYRVDARGNKPGVDAQFLPPREQLAWPVGQPGELDYRLNLPRPLAEVVRALRRDVTVVELWRSLPTSVVMA